MDNSPQFVGIDVSKATLDVALFQASCWRTRRVSNTRPDFVALLRFLHTYASGPLHVCLEPTSTYHDEVLAFLTEQGIPVSLVPPSRIAAFRRSEGSRHKTDKQDAVLLAKYGQQKQPAAFVAVPAELEELRSLLARLDQLTHLRQQEHNRLENGRLPQGIRAQIEEHLQQLTAWQKQMVTQIRAWVKEHEEMARAQGLLESITGIGERSAWRLLALMGPDARRFSCVSQVAVYVGLDVVQHQSGTSVKGAGHISKQGSPQVRRVLGMCAIVAKRWDPDMQQWAKELTGRGKKSRVVRVAIMRKLLFLAYGVLKSQKPYDPRRAWPTHQHPSGEEAQAA